jgi:hypothetical protein
MSPSYCGLALANKESTVPESSCLTADNNAHGPSKTKSREYTLKDAVSMDIIPSRNMEIYLFSLVILVYGN